LAGVFHEAHTWGESDPDRYVADMARLISGLGDGPLLDLVAE
jgi:hypothetical protein